MPTIVITGANRGIGLALARCYAERGDRVIATCRDPGAAEALRALADGSDGRVAVRTLDIGDPESIARFADAIDAPIDVLINNAGIYGGARQTLDDIDYDAWLDAFAVMTLGPFRLVKALLPRLEAAAAPKIMTVSTQMAASTWRHSGSYIYNSAKAAGNRVSQILAIDLAPKGIAVGYIHPGWVRTDMGGKEADLTPEESAAGIAAVTDGLALANTGRFWKWNGDEHPL